MYSTWQYLSLDDTALCKLSFDLYNSSKTGFLLKDEMKELYYIIYGLTNIDNVDDKVNFVFNMLAYHKETVTMEEYLFNLSEVPELVTPFFILRDKLRSIILGSKFWKKMEPKAHE